MKIREREREMQRSNENIQRIRIYCEIEILWAECVNVAMVTDGDNVRLVSFINLGRISGTGK